MLLQFGYSKADIVDYIGKLPHIVAAGVAHGLKALPLKEGVPDRDALSALLLEALSAEPPRFSPPYHPLSATAAAAMAAGHSLSNARQLGSPSRSPVLPTPTPPSFYGTPAPAPPDGTLVPTPPFREVNPALLPSSIGHEPPVGYTAPPLHPGPAPYGGLPPRAASIPLSASVPFRQAVAELSLQFPLLASSFELFATKALEAGYDGQEAVECILNSYLSKDPSLPFFRIAQRASTFLSALSPEAAWNAALSTCVVASSSSPSPLPPLPSRSAAPPIGPHASGSSPHAPEWWRS